MSWKACELVWQRGWRCTISASGSTIGSAVPVWPLPICWDGDLNSHQAFKNRDSRKFISKILHSPGPLGLVTPMDRYALDCMLTTADICLPKSSRGLFRSHPVTL